MKYKLKLSYQGFTAGEIFIPYQVIHSPVDPVTCFEFWSESTLRILTIRINRAHAATIPKEQLDYYFEKVEATSAKSNISPFKN